jgi:hypothetical protein
MKLQIQITPDPERLRRGFHVCMPLQKPGLHAAADIAIKRLCILANKSLI